jgi:hypothetical protein
MDLLVERGNLRRRHASEHVRLSLEDGRFVRDLIDSAATSRPI